MELKMIEAFEKALVNPKVITLIATLTAKEIVKQKSNPSNLEDKLVREHVLFAEEGSETGTFMTTKEISEEILGFNDELTIRPRVFGKALIAEAKETKDSSQGRVYLVEAVVKEITADLLENIAANITVKDVEEVKSTDEILSFEDVEGMEVNELLEVIESYKIKVKGKKKMSTEDLRAAIQKALDLSEEEEETVEDTVEAPEVDKDLLTKALEEFESFEEYKEHLSSMSTKALIKHINKHKMPVICQDKSEDEIVASIIELMEVNLKATFSIEDSVDSKESKKEKKKAKKKAKKDKKKAKKSKK